MIGEDRPYGAVSTDSRTLPAGALFVALRGPKFDGAEFVAAAPRAGPSARWSSAPLGDASCRRSKCRTALAALQQLGRAGASKFSIPIVGVGGSNGKTTAKEMTAAILSRRGPCMATHGNLNNHIGVPVTLMRLEPSHRSAVIEMGANRIGDVAELVALARPTVGLITNAGAEHLEGFGDLDGVAQGEGEMVSGSGRMPPPSSMPTMRTRATGAASPAARASSPSACARLRISRRRISFRRSSGASSPRASRSSARSGSAPSLKAGGAHNIANALAAAAAAAAAGASLEDIAFGLAEFRAVAGRLQLKAGLRDSWIIDDSYNANPSSVRAGLEVLRSLSGATWLVLADMAELGEHTSDSHAELGRYARDCGVKRLFAFGPESSRAVETFGSGGEWFADVDSLIRRLQAEIAPGVTVLIKGSRVNRLERVVQALLGGAASSGPMMRAS